ncbi:MAG: hypothetical protein Q8Q31_00090 [Nanoarchaeota archaeon]|nr:hypothetical protein [Nanoarchaeota archaeon]
MKRPYKLAVVLLLVALVFSVASFVIVNYFPEVRGYNDPSSNTGGVPGGNLKITIEKPVSEENLSP